MKANGSDAGGRRTCAVCSLNSNNPSWVHFSSHSLRFSGDIFALCFLNVLLISRKRLNAKFGRHFLKKKKGGGRRLATLTDTDQGDVHLLHLLVQVAHLDRGVFPYVLPVNVKYVYERDERTYSTSWSISKEKYR